MVTGLRFLKEVLLGKSWKFFFNLFLTFFVALSFISCSSSRDHVDQPIYTMILDAGSSGTRINFYKVIPGKGGYPQISLLDSQSFDDNGINDFLNGTGTIDPETWTENTSTGLPKGYSPKGCRMNAQSINGGQQDILFCVLQPLLDSMSGAMTTAGVSPNQVKVELFSTAGMRTMSNFNGGSFSESQIKNFYDTMKEYVHKKRGFAVGDFRTSNGNSEEGLWTWINLNDQYFNAFGGNQKYYKGSPTTRGNFEVGGSSMQVAFPTSRIPPGDKNNVYPVKINGYSYNVFSKTFLGLGGDDMRKYMRAYGYGGKPDSSYTGRDCFGSAANNMNTKEDSGVALFNAPFFPSVSVPRSGNPTGVVWTSIVSNSEPSPLVLKAPGEYKLSDCSTKYGNVINAVIGLPRNNYGTNHDGVKASYDDFIKKIGASNASFVGLDGFYWPAKSLGLAPDTQLKSNFSREQFVSAIASICPDGGAGPSGKKLKAVRVCPDAAYMNQFLWNFSGSGGLFTSNTGAKFEGVVPNSYKGESILSWSRGYLLQKYAN